MASRAPASPEQRRFTRAATISLGVAIVLVVVLTPAFPADFRQSVSGVGLLLTGGAATASGARKAWASRHSPVGRPWLVLTIAGLVLIVGNAWVAASGSDPVTSPSLFGNASIAVALVLSVLALVLFPDTKRRGSELMVMLLDGLVTGGAFLLIASVLVYSRLLDTPTTAGGANRAFSLLFPALDVLLATLAVLLVVRASRTDRLLLVLVAAAFLLYAASDLAFAVRTAQGTFHFGTLLDLGWLAGYLTLGVAAWTPEQTGSADDETSAGLADALGTTLVFSVLLLATLVQVLFGGRGGLEGARSVLWVVIVLGAGGRQALLTIDNSTLRRGLERRVQEQTAHLRRLARQNEALVTSVGDGIYGVDQDGIVTFVNPSGAALLGLTTDQLVGRPAHDAFHAPSPDGSLFPYEGCYIHEAISLGVLTQAREDDYLKADGSTFPVEITASPLTDESEFRGAVVVFRDVTQRREVDRMKNEFLSVVSHELRTPLTSIQGSLGLLAGGRLGELPEQAAPLVGVALRSSERLTRLINDLLDIERLETGSHPLEVADHDAAKLLATAAGQIEGMASSLAVRVEVGPVDGRVSADDDQIVQTLLNLLGNAVKFSEPGSVVQLTAQARDHDVVFAVSDEGRGIPADKLESIFERFEQVDSSDTRQRGGTGLGLTISRSIVTRHGGEIWAESEFGVGTTVRFTLPRSMVVPAPTATLFGGDGDVLETPGSPVVLVCDDDATIVEQFCSLLRERGFQPVGVTDGARAVELALARRPDVIVLDLLMPDTSGAHVLDALRTSLVTQQIPVVVVSGMGPEADAVTAGSADQWLVKPVSAERLVQAVSLAAQGHPPDGSVLLVEDDESLAHVLVTMLADHGLEVVRASNASEAVVLGTERHPDVIILDLALPDGSGTDVVAELSRRGTLAATSLVVYSAADVRPDQREALRLGRTLYLTKSRTTPEQLRDQVLDLVRAVTTSQPITSGRG